MSNENRYRYLTSLKLIESSISVKTRGNSFFGHELSVHEIVEVQRISWTVTFLPFYYRKNQTQVHGRFREMKQQQQKEGLNQNPFY